MENLDSKQREILEALNISSDDFTPEQLRKFEKHIKNIPNPHNMTAQQAIDLVNIVGLDLKTLQKKLDVLWQNRKIVIENRK